MSNIFIDTAKRARRCHYTFGFGHKGKKGIQPGERHLVISNGTIGRGHVTENVCNSKAILLLERLLKELQNIPAPPKDEDYKIVWERPNEDNGHLFTADDIPF